MPRGIRVVFVWIFILLGGSARGEHEPGQGAAAQPPLGSSAPQSRLQVVVDPECMNRLPLEQDRLTALQKELQSSEESLRQSLSALYPLFLQCGRGQEAEISLDASDDTNGDVRLAFHCDFFRDFPEATRWFDEISADFQCLGVDGDPRSVQALMEQLDLEATPQCSPEEEKHKAAEASCYGAMGCALTQAALGSSAASLPVQVVESLTGKSAIPACGTQQGMGCLGEGMVKSLWEAVLFVFQIPEELWEFAGEVLDDIRRDGLVFTLVKYKDQLDEARTKVLAFIFVVYGQSAESTLQSLDPSNLGPVWDEARELLKNGPPAVRGTRGRIDPTGVGSRAAAAALVGELRRLAGDRANGAGKPPQPMAVQSIQRLLDRMADSPLSLPYRKQLRDLAAEVGSYEDSGLQQFLSDPAGYLQLHSEAILQVLWEVARNEFGCLDEGMDGISPEGNCQNPSPEWECATCRQRTEAICAMVGFVGTELLQDIALAVVTAGTATAAKWATTNLAKGARWGARIAKKARGNGKFARALEKLQGRFRKAQAAVSESAFYRRLREFGKPGRKLAAHLLTKGARIGAPLVHNSIETVAHIGEMAYRIPVLGPYLRFVDDIQGQVWKQLGPGAPLLGKFESADRLSRRAGIAEPMTPAQRQHLAELLREGLPDSGPEVRRLYRSLLERGKHGLTLFTPDQALGVARALDPTFKLPKIPVDVAKSKGLAVDQLTLLSRVDPGLSPANLRSAVDRVAKPNATAADRIAAAEMLGVKVDTPEKRYALEAAHFVGVGQPGSDHTLARWGTYTGDQLRALERVLEDFPPAERRRIVHGGIAGFVDGATESAFFRSMVTDPENFQTSRLVFSDWLQEQGMDEAAEYLRMRARDIPPTQQSVVREHALAPQAARQWQEFLRERGVNPVSTPFWNKGSVGVDIETGLPRYSPYQTHEYLELASEQASLLPVLDLTGRGLSNADVGRIAQSDHLRNVLKLDLSENAGVNDAAIRQLVDSGRTGNLRVLSLRSTGAGDGAVDALIQSGNLGNLRTLDLTLTSISETGWARLRQAIDEGRFPNLHEIRGPARQANELKAALNARATRGVQLDPRVAENVAALEAAGIRLDEAQLASLNRLANPDATAADRISAADALGIRVRGDDADAIKRRDLIEETHLVGENNPDGGWGNNHWDDLRVKWTKLFEATDHNGQPLFSNEERKMLIAAGVVGKPSQSNARRGVLLPRRASADPSPPASPRQPASVAPRVAGDSPVLTAVRAEDGSVTHWRSRGGLVYPNRPRQGWTAADAREASQGRWMRERDTIAAQNRETFEKLEELSKRREAVLSNSRLSETMRNRLLAQIDRDFDAHIDDLARGEERLATLRRNRRDYWVDNNRVIHVMDHAVPNGTKDIHGVFSVTQRDEVFELLDEAWARALPHIEAGDIGDVVKVETFTVDGSPRLTVTVEMDRSVGWVDGRLARENPQLYGREARHMVLAFDNASVDDLVKEPRIYTAYPMRIDPAR